MPQDEVLKFMKECKDRNVELYQCKKVPGKFKLSMQKYPREKLD